MDTLSTPAAAKRAAAQPEKPSLKQRIGRQLVARFNARRRLGAPFQQVPAGLHRVANQLSLGLELLEDFRRGDYRSVPWGSLAVLSGALLYAVSPADVIPDALLGIGSLDDAIVVALAVKLVRPQLEAYCRHKGYRLEDYFPPASDPSSRKKASTLVTVEPADLPA